MVPMRYGSRCDARRALCDHYALYIYLLICLVRKLFFKTLLLLEFLAQMTKSPRAIAIGRCLSFVRLFVRSVVNISYKMYLLLQFSSDRFKILQACSIGSWLYRVCFSKRSIHFFDFLSTSRNALNGNDCACLRFEEICLYFCLYKVFRERLWSHPPYLNFWILRIFEIFEIFM